MYIIKHYPYTSDSCIQYETFLEELTEELTTKKELKARLLELCDFSHPKLSDNDYLSLFLEDFSKGSKISKTGYQNYIMVEYN